MSVLDELDVRLRLGQLFIREHEQIQARITQAHTSAMENGHRFLLLLTAVLALAVPGAAASTLVHTGWLRWGAVWFGACMALEVVSLRVGQYLVAWSLLKSNEYTKRVINIIADNAIDDDGLRTAFEAIGNESTNIQASANRSLIVNGALGGLSDLLVYGTFIFGVYCLCAALLAGGGA